MNFVQFETSGNIAKIALNRPKANTLNLTFLRELLEAFELAEADEDVRAVVLTSLVPRFFSAGFDVMEVFAYDREQMTAFLSSFGRLVGRILHFPKPVVAALPGHTVTGGAILALACDFRVMAEGNYRIAMNEIDLGVVLPGSIFRMLSNAVGIPAARRMILSGAALTPAEGLAAGFLTKLTAEEQVQAAALELAQLLASKPGDTYLGLKRVINKESGVSDAEFTPAVDPWFTAEALAQKEKIRAGMQR